MDSRNTLLKIAENFLFEDFDEDKYKNLNNDGLVEKIQMDFQDELKSFYQDSEFKKQIKKLEGDNLDEQVLHLLANLSAPKENNPQIASQLPKFNKKCPNAGFECTLASALIRFALEDLGFKDTYTLLLRRHMIAMRELKGNKLKIYDAGNRHTKDGQTLGFVYIFNPSRVKYEKEIRQKNGRVGFTFTLKSKRPIKYTDVFNEKDKKGYFSKQFLAYDPAIYIPLAVILENLSEFKNQKDNYSVKLCKEYPILKKLDFKKLKKDMNLFDGYDYLD